VLPDIATCAECLDELNDTSDRRHGYPFTNCTNCGPRFTIVRALPYDRPNSTMAGFTMCARCRAEYENPLDRRFHAQPNACPECGPQVALWDAGGAILAMRDDAIARAAADLAAGRTLAVQGLGGFHLVCDANDDAAVRHLRERKPRLEKPFALMVRDLAQARGLCEVDDAAAAALARAEAPIVLMPRRAGAPIAASVAPGLTTLGVMLAYTPLHHRLLAAFGRPVVATSGNLTTARSSATWMTAWAGSWMANSLCCAARAALHHCRCAWRAHCRRSWRSAPISRTRWRSGSSARCS
jgi:hydrogenase maturation protein HypF